MSGIANVFVMGDIGYDVTLLTVTMDLAQCPDPDSITVHIDSFGGDCVTGWGIHDKLVSQGVPIKTVVEGYCASMATIIALSGTEREMFENAYYMIHNPWTISMGNADQMEADIASLRKAEEKMADFYARVTGQEVKAIQKMMDAETDMDASEALAKGFITTIITTVQQSEKIAARREHSKIYARARVSPAAEAKKIPLPKNDTMSKSILTILASAVESITKAFSDEAIQGGKIAADEGTLYFDGATATAGTAVFSDEKMTEAAADGDYSSDGMTYTVASGKVDKVGDDQEEEDDEKASALAAKLTADAGELAALRAEFDAYKAGHISARAEAKEVGSAAQAMAKKLTEAAAMIDAQKAEIAKTRDEVRAEIKSGFVPDNGSRATKGQKEDAPKESNLKKQLSGNPVATSTLAKSKA